MTAFSGASGVSAVGNWRWEMRSVNGKGLDIRLRMPSGFERLEDTVRKRVGEKLARGNVLITLSLEGRAQNAVPVVADAALNAVAKAIAKVDKALVTRPSSAAEILSIRGVLEWQDPAGMAEMEAASSELLNGFAKVLGDFLDGRRSEGKALEAVLTQQLDEMQAIADELIAQVGDNAGVIETRFRENLAKVTDKSDIDETRLYSELALLMTKADIREETDRLSAHITAARDLIGEGSPVGRKLEFLAQELNRETNTICSKSNDLAITRSGLALKAVVDQFREQSLNVE